MVNRFDTVNVSDTIYSCKRNTSTLTGSSLQDTQIMGSVIKSINQVKSEDVYDIEVEDEHEFFANGFLVHNCQLYIRVGLDRFREDRATFHESSNNSFAFQGLDIRPNDTTRL